jgi:hypothetical protein
MKKKITDFTEIKSFEDAQKATGRPDVPAFADAPEDMREWLQNLYRAAVITEAINGDWKADWTDTDQWKYVPWFEVDSSSPSGFAFGVTYYWYSRARAGGASRLCFETSAKAAHAGRTFTEIFAAIITR